MNNLGTTSFRHPFGPRGRLFQSVGRSSRQLLALALVALAVGLSTPAAAQEKGNYVIGPQDVLGITVWDQADLSGRFTVESDGSFSYPLIGRIKAGGMTLRDFEIELKRRLSDGYLKNPQVAVAVEQYHSQRVFVVGEVHVPGTYPLTGDMTLMEALARAGSTTPEAASEAIVVRAPSGRAASAPQLPGAAGTEVVKVDVRALQEGRLADTVTLRDGDTVFVPRATPDTIYVSGQVRSPGAHVLLSRDTTVLQAVSLAGGLTDRAASNRIRIIRVVSGTKTEIRVKLSDLVQPGDTLVVPERYF